MRGYIKDHRQELASDIWAMPPLYHRLWQWLKYKANHDDTEIPMADGSKLLIKKGQHLTSVRKIANGIGWYERGLWKEPNPKTVGEMLKWLSDAQMITIDNGNRKYTLITLVNWAFYQISCDESNAKVTVRKQSLETNNNDKNEKKIKPIVDSDECDSTFETFWTSYPKKQGKANAQKKWKDYFKKGLIEINSIMEGLEQYKRFIDAERSRGFDRQYLDGATFVNQQRWKDDWSVKPVLVKGQAPPKREEPKYGVHQMTQEELEMMPRG